MANKDPYGRSAAWYDRLLGPLQSGVREVALKVLPPEHGWEVLDVGCGTGTGLVPYVEAGCVAHGVDVSPAMLRQAQPKLEGKADLRLTDGDVLPFHDGRFDLVMTSMVLHEVPEGDRVAFLSEMARVTKPSGRVLIIDFRFGSLRGLKGRMLRWVSAVIERFSGHHSGYRTFRSAGGVPSIADDAGLSIDTEKILGGGNMAIYVITPTS